MIAFITGGAGAPIYPVDVNPKVPWKNAVQKKAAAYS